MIAKSLKYLFWSLSALIIISLIAAYAFGSGLPLLMEYKGLVAILFLCWWLLSYLYMRAVKHERIEKRKNRNYFNR